MASTPLQRLSIFVAANETVFEPLKLVFPFVLAVNPQPLAAALRHGNRAEFPSSEFPFETLIHSYLCTLERNSRGFLSKSKRQGLSPFIWSISSFMNGFTVTGLSCPHKLPSRQTYLIENLLPTLLPSVRSRGAVSDYFPTFLEATM